MEVIKLVVASIGAAILLTACGAMKNSQTKQELADDRMYCNSMMNSSALDSIRTKIVLGEGDPAFDMLADTSKPTNADKPVIHEFAERRMECQSRTKATLVSNNNTTKYRIIMESYWGIFNGLVAQLYNGEITYGEFNKQRKKNQNDGQMALKNADDQAVAQAQQAYQTYLMQVQTMNQQRIINQATQPKPNPTINCYTSGAYTTCN
jgi:hypothetical protein